MYYDIIHFYNHFLYNETKLSKYIDMQRQTNLLLLVNIGDIYKSKLCV